MPPAYNPFKPASLRKARVKMAIHGPSKGGKTWKALAIATSFIRRLGETGALVGNGKIAAIDSESESMLKYADQFKFDHCPLEDFSPESYIQHANYAVSAGYSVLIIDSISHEWVGVGGVLDYHSSLSERQGFNSYTAWNQAGKKHSAFLDMIIRHKCHVIATVRSKQKTIPVMEGQRITGVRKLGIRPIQRKDSEYEFDIFGEATEDHDLVFKGTRCRYLSDRKFSKDQTDEVGTILADWISESGDGEEEHPPRIDQATIDEIHGLKESLRMNEKGWVAFLTRYSVASTDALTESSAKDVIKFLRDKYTKATEPKV